MLPTVCPPALQANGTANMGCDFYLNTWLTGCASVPRPLAPGSARAPARKRISLHLKSEPCYDHGYDSDSDGDRERQRQGRVPEPKILMADGKWNISSKDKREFYERRLRAEHPEITHITDLQKMYDTESRQ